MTPQPSTSLRVRFAKAMGYRIVDASFECLPAPWPRCGVGPPATIENESNYFRLVRGEKFITSFRWWNYKKPEQLWPTLENCEQSLPLIDSNTVREAWKTLNFLEKERVVELLIKKLDINPLERSRLDRLISAIRDALDEEPTTLAELICEVRKCMSTEKQKQIIRIWEDIEENDPDISTEALLEVVGQKCRVDTDTVIAAMVSEGYWKELNP
jgi:hypothetical protein